MIPKLGFKDWLLLAAGVAILALGFEACRKSLVINSTRGDLKAVEGRLVETNGAFVASEAGRRELERDVETFKGEIDSLATELGRRPAVKEVVKWKTAPGTVPIPTELRCPPGWTLAEMEGKDWCVPAENSGSASSGGGCPSEVPGRLEPCPEPKIELRGLEARLETSGKNLIAVGQVEVWRTDPPPVERVQTLPWQVAEVKRLDETGDLVRWFLGPAVGLASGSGVQYGVAAVSPPVNLGRLTIRFGGDALTDLDGNGQATATMLFGVRRR